jgi:sulfatase maturation enzyme AslB (radical SAM superfamily)
MTNQQDFFCHLPFVSVLTNGITAAPCCKFQSKSPIPLDNYNTHPEIIEVRKLLFDGTAPAQCATCVLEEKQSGKSFRTLANDFHPDLSKEVKAHNAKYINLRFVDVVGSNICNLQCLPCESSSFKRSQELYELGFRPTIPIVQNIENIRKIADLPIESLTLCAGEPFYDKQTWNLLELVVQKTKSRRIRLDINTNLTGITVDRLQWLESNFDQIWIKGSIDGLGNTNDYLRYPSKWHVILESVDMILSRPQVNFVITTALSNLSLLTYPTFINHFLSKGVRDFFISQVTHPQVLNCSNLPEHLKTKVRSDLESLAARSDLTDRTRDAIDLCINLCLDDYAWTPKPLTEFLDAHDELRHSNWRQTWPQLAGLC